jgi:hypothetical protein
MVPFGTSRVVLTLVKGIGSGQVELVPDKDQTVEVPWKKRASKYPKPQGKDDIFRADQLPEEPTP